MALVLPSSAVVTNTTTKEIDPLWIGKEKRETETKIKLMSERYIEIEKNNLELIKTNEKLQNKMNKIVNKNKMR